MERSGTGEDGNRAADEAGQDGYPERKSGGHGCSEGVKRGAHQVKGIPVEPPRQ